MFIRKEKASQVTYLLVNEENIRIGMIVRSRGYVANIQLTQTPRSLSHPEVQFIIKALLSNYVCAKVHEMAQRRIGRNSGRSRKTLAT